MSTTNSLLKAAWGAILCLGLFAVLRSRPMPVGMLGITALLGAAACLAYGVSRAGNARLDVFGLSRPRSPAGGWLAAGVILGVLAGAGYRANEGLHAWPTTVGSFAVMAAAIGAAEELVYRGYIQTGLLGSGRFSAVVFAAAGHTAYKCLLFAWRPEAGATDFGFLAVATFLAGIALGYLRETARSIWPPILAHSAFDIMVYGALHDPPWWVWG